MKKKLFAIPSLLAAGLFPAQSLALAALRQDDDHHDPSLFHLFKKNHFQVMSAHRSHSSHASHGSHRSSSGGYGGYTAPRVYTPSPPTRNYNSTPPSSILPSTPSAAAKATPSTPNALVSPRSATNPQIGPADAAAINAAERFKDVVKVVQLALQAYGYYSGPIDGQVGTGTSTAISKMQTDYGLKVTGTVTPEVLNALKIKSN